MTLTERQMQIIFGIAAGLTLRMLADRMGIKANTARHYLKAAGYTLGDGNVVRLLRSAVTAGYLPANALAIPTHILLRKVPAKGVSTNVKRKR